MNLAVATMIPVSEWRDEAERDIRSISTALDILREQEDRLSQPSDPGAGGPSAVQYSG